jgi:hypothetical protein
MVYHRAHDSLLNIVRHYPEGISAEELAPKLGFNTANQIGGLTGPGLVKIAEASGFSPDDIYTSVVTFPYCKRRQCFVPAKLLKPGHVKKPA